jgi:hypothetical protein
LIDVADIDCWQVAQAMYRENTSIMMS